MATIIAAWTCGSIKIAVEAGRADMNHEGTHVHIYKNNHRTRSRIPGINKDLDYKDYDTAEQLYYNNLAEITRICEEVAAGKHGE